MGGSGSGTWQRWDAKMLIEDCRSLNVNALNKAGFLSPGHQGSWGWWNAEGKRNAWIELRMDDEDLILSYRYRENSEEWQEVDQRTGVYWMPCQFGGKRPYFLCPGVTVDGRCQQRALKLYAAGPNFWCRQCHRLAFSSQNESAWDHALRRVNETRARLGGAPGIDTPFPERPKGMWQRTYARLRHEALMAETAVHDEFLAKATRLLGRTKYSDQGRGFWR